MKRSLSMAMFVLSVSAFAPAPARAQGNKIVVQETAITSTAGDIELAPSLGADAIGEYVVYTSRLTLPGVGYGPGEIWMQRLNADGSPDGARVSVSSDPIRDDEYPDAYGRHVVYIAFDTVRPDIGVVHLYDTTTGLTEVLAAPDEISDAQTRRRWGRRRCVRRR